jgi:hypothetical protein
LESDRRSARSFRGGSSQIHHIGFSGWIGHSLSTGQFHNRAMDRDQTGRSALLATLIAICFCYRSSRPNNKVNCSRDFSSLFWRRITGLSLRHFRRRTVLGCFTISKFTLAPSFPVSVASPE